MAAAIAAPRTSRSSPAFRAVAPTNNARSTTSWMPRSAASAESVRASGTPNARETRSATAGSPAFTGATFPSTKPSARGGAIAQGAGTALPRIAFQARTLAAIDPKKHAIESAIAPGGMRRHTSAMW